MRLRDKDECHKICYETYLALGAAGPKVPWYSSLYFVDLLTLR